MSGPVRFVSIDEVASTLSVSTSTVRRLIRRGRLVAGFHFVRVGRQLRFDLAAVRAAFVPASVPSGRPAISESMLAELE